MIEGVVLLTVDFMTLDCVVCVMEAFGDDTSGMSIFSLGCCFNE